MTPLPGDFFVTSDGPLNSTLTGSVFSNLIQWGTRSIFNHAGVFVGDGTVVEAQPGGARRASVTPYLAANTVWSDGYGIDPAVTPPVRDAICREALKLVGTPYGWPDIVAVTLAQKRLGHWQMVDSEKPAEQQPWWVKRLARTDRLICSQLVDYAYFLAGVHLFMDGRCFGLVSPGDLGRLLGQ